MKFKDFLAESFKKTYGYRIKIAADCKDEHITIIEDCLDKYSLESMAPMNRQPIQENPTEFVRAKGVKFISEVCSTDVVLKYPANTRILEVWIAVHLGLDVDRVLVYEVKDPRVAEADLAAARVAHDEDRSVTEEDSILIQEDDVTVEMDLYYGEGHKEKFLQELQRIKQEKGANYFRAYPTKDDVMGDTLRPVWDELMNIPNMGKSEGTKEVHNNDQNLGGPL